MVQWYNGTIRQNVYSTSARKNSNIFGFSLSYSYFANRMKPAIIEDIVLLHMTADYNPGTLARSIKRYFELNPYAREVLVYKGKKEISVTRKSLEDTNFFRTFIRRYAK